MILPNRQPPYDRKEEVADETSGLLSENPAGDALSSALQNRRQKLASKKIGLNPTSPEDASEE